MRFKTYETMFYEHAVADRQEYMFFPEIVTPFMLIAYKPEKKLSRTANVAGNVCVETFLKI